MCGGWSAVLKPVASVSAGEPIRAVPRGVRSLGYLKGNPD